MTTHTNARPMPAVDPQPLGEWYHQPGRSPHFQGQIADEKTGATIAIAYNDESGVNGELIARAPALLRQRDALAEAVRSALIASEDDGDMNDINWAELRAALAMCD